MVLDASLLNTQHYKVRIKGKVEQSREGVAPPPLHIVVVAIEKGAFGLPSTMVANFTLLTYMSVNYGHYRHMDVENEIAKKTVLHFLNQSTRLKNMRGIRSSETSCWHYKMVEDDHVMKHSSLCHTINAK